MCLSIGDRLKSYSHLMAMGSLEPLAARSSRLAGADPVRATDTSFD